MEKVDQDGAQLVTSILTPHIELHLVVPGTTQKNGWTAEDVEVERKTEFSSKRLQKRSVNQLIFLQKFI